MFFTELFYKYKALNKARRWLIASLVALLPAIYVYFSEGDVLVSELDIARIDNQAAESKLKSSNATKKELLSLQDSYTETEKLLQRARKFLPDKVAMDEVLALAGRFEKELNLRIKKFGPPDLKSSSAQAGRPIDFSNLRSNARSLTETVNSNQSQEPHRNYREIPLELELESDFGPIMDFIDRMVHLEIVTHVRDLSISSVKNSSGTTNNNVQQETKNIAKLKLVFFESLGG